MAIATLVGKIASPLQDTSYYERDGCYTNKVPTLRRWGKKLAVVVDRAFFEALGRMEEADDISNADLLWFILSFERTNGRFRLVRDRIHATTLERATEALTGGSPVSKQVFEQSLGN